MGEFTKEDEKMFKIHNVLLLFFTVILSLAIMMSAWTDRNLDYWMSIWRGREIDVPFWMSVVLSAVLNAIMLLLNIVGEIARYCNG